jgi:3-hydroxyacyl-CoA dehydrogenase
MTKDCLMPKTVKTAVVIGAGVIGRSWALLFLGHGCSVTLVEPDALRRAAATDWILAQGGGTEMLTLTDDLADACRAADWIQECGPDTAVAKQAIFRVADQHAPSSAVLASSGSTFDPTDLQTGLRHPGRVLLVHPFNPPHLLPAVELVPGLATEAETLARATAFMKALGRVPVVLQRYVPGLVINRLQGALMREAFDLYDSGIADIAGIDRCIADGLALRWLSVGTFGTNDTNADGGIGEYFSKFPDWSDEMAALSAKAPVFTADYVTRLASDMRQAVGGTGPSDLAGWRDRMIRAVLALKHDDPGPSGV